MPTATGTTDIQTSYAGIFENIQLDVKFSIEELVVSSSFAYALTQSAGKVTIKAASEDGPIDEANREIFIFAKEQSEWKIARYMFNKSS